MERRGGGRCFLLSPSLPPFCGGATATLHTRTERKKVDYGLVADKMSPEVLLLPAVYPHVFLPVCPLLVERTVNRQMISASLT